MSEELEPFIERVWLIECDRCSDNLSIGGQKKYAARQAALMGWWLMPKNTDTQWVVCPRCATYVNVAGVLG